MSDDPTAHTEQTVAGPRPATLDHLRSRKKAQRGYVDIVIDEDLADAYEEARQRHDLLKLRSEGKPGDLDLHAEYADAIETLARARAELVERDGIVRVWMRSLAPHAYDHLLAAHPPEKQHREQAKAMGGIATFNPDTFPAALIAASLVEPALSEDEVRSLYDDPEWSTGDLTAMFNEALRLNSGRRTVSLGNG